MATSVVRAFPTPEYGDTASQSLGVIATSTTVYVAIETGTNGAAVDVKWLDTTTAASLALQCTNSPPGEAPVRTAGTAEKWGALPAASIVGTLSGPAGGSVGSSKVRIKDVPGARVRLAITTTAASQLIVDVQPRDI